MIVMIVHWQLIIVSMIESELQPIESDELDEQKQIPVGLHIVIVTENDDADDELD